MIVEYSKFRELFDLPDKVDYDTFRKELRVKRNQKVMDYTLDEFIDKRDDWRGEKRDEFFQVLYKWMVEDRENTLEAWFNAHIKIDSVEKHMYFLLDRDIRDQDGSINGSLKNKGRIIKNINFDKIFGTKKYYDDDPMSMIKSLRELVQENIITHVASIPNGFNVILRDDLNTFFAIMRGTRHRASIFNPYTYGWLLDNYFEGSKVLAPVAGWNSYQIGFHQSNWSEFTCIDVIESVIENAHKISDYYKSQNILGVVEDKVVNAHCCPSEEIDLEEKNYYDLIMFSPPYYNLEIYEDNPNQSIQKYPDYKDWLEGYWDATVRNMIPSLKKGSPFTFVISNYKNVFGQKSENYGKWSEMKISEDMLEVAKRYLKHEKTEKIIWNTFKSVGHKKTQSGEDLHILT